MAIASSSFARSPIALYLIAFASGVALAATSLGCWQQTRTFAAHEIVPAGGSAYVVVYPGERMSRSMFVHRSDSNDAPTVSRLKLFENGRAIGEPHADHASVRERGLGRYSDWTWAGGNQLAFSTPDNSDPRTNGRTYSIAYPLEPTPLARLLTALVCGVAAAVFVLRNRASIARAMRRGLQAAGARTAFVGVSYAIGAIVLLASFGVWRHTDLVDSASIVSIGGNAYSLPLKPQSLNRSIFGREPDRNDAPRASRLVLLENGQPLRPAHSPHASIRETGNGAYSHWGTPTGPDIVLFSTADNSNPITNQRTYAVNYPLTPGWILQLVTAALILAATTLWHRTDTGRQYLQFAAAVFAHSRLWVLPVLIAAVYVVRLYAWQMPAVPLLARDSVDYLMAWPSVPLGYRVFAGLVAASTGDLAALPAIQTSLWAASVITLYCALARTLHVRAVAGVTCVALLLFGTATKYAVFALTESVFMSILVLHVAAVVRVLDKPTTFALLSVAGTAFLAAFLRPAGYFVPGATFALLLLVPSARLRVLKLAIVPMALLFLVAGTASQAYRGVATQSLLGLALFPYVAHAFQADYVPDLQPAARNVERALSDYRAQWRAQPNLEQRIRFEMENFNSVWRQAEAALKLAGIPESDTNDYFSRFAFATLRAQPFGYLQQVAEHSVHAWLMLFYPIETGAWIRQNYLQLQADHNDFAGRITTMTVPNYDYPQLLSGNRNLNRASAVLDFVPNALASIPRFGEILGVLSAALIVAGVLLRSRSGSWAPAMYLALLMHAAVLLITSTTIVIWRYLDPVAVLAVILVAVLVDRAAMHAGTRVLH